MATATLNHTTKTVEVLVKKEISVPNTITLTLSLEEAIAVRANLGKSYGNYSFRVHQALCMVGDCTEIPVMNMQTVLRAEREIEEKAKEMRENG